LRVPGPPVLTTATTDSLDFLADGGEAGAAMRAPGWASPVLGAPDSWPQSLRSVVGLMLGAKFPMFVAWGPGLGLLYNDGYAEILGAKHPAALGSRFDDVWSEIWPDISPLIDAALAGRPSYHEDLPLLVNRRGFDERAWFTFSYSPVRDETGAIAGMFCAVQETTSRIDAERRIVAEGRRFAELFEQAPAFMAVLSGPDHVVDLVNSAYLRLVGHREMLGRRVADALPDAVEQGYIALLDQVYRTGEAYVATGARYRVQPTPDVPVDERMVDFVFQPITDAAGATTGILVHGIDTTDAHQADLALRESEDHYRHAVELDPQTSWTSAPDGQLDSVNRRWFEWTGTSGLGSSYADGLHADDRQRTFDVWGRSVGTGEPYDIEHRVKMRDGAYRWMHSRAYPRRDAAGRIVKWYGTTEDIHERRLAEERLGASEAFNRRVLESSGDYIEVLGLDGRVERASERARDALGAEDRVGGIGEDWARIFDPGDRAAAHAAVAEARSGRTARFEAALRTRAGERRWWDALVSPIAGADGRPEKILALSRDITDRRLVEERERFLLRLADLTRAESDPAKLTAAAAEAVGRQLGVDRAGYGEIDADRMIMGVARDWTAAPDLPSLAGFARPLDRLGPMLLAHLNAGRTAAIPDIGALAGADPATVAGWSAVGVRAVLVVPLVRDGELRALLFLHSATPRRWTPAEVELAEAVAQRTWDALGRAKAEAALRDETRTLETLNRIGTALAAELDLDRLVQMVTDAGVELTGARYGAYFHNILDETGERLHLYTLSGADRADFEALGHPRPTGLFAPTFRNEGVVRADDVLVDPRYGQADPRPGMPMGHLPVRSYMGVPVVSRSGVVLGGLLFGHPEPGRFTERHEQLMLGIAAQAAVAIDNARLFQAEQRLNETLEQRVLERTLELEDAHEALRQSQKMEAVGQLTGGIAHDFNNMLAVVIGSLDLLGRRVGIDDPRARRYLDAASDGARRAALLTQRLLAFSRQQPLRPEPVDANGLVAGMSDLLRHSLGPDIQLTTDLAEALWRTHADPNQLENAILNLAVNARDAMPDGGRLSIATGNSDRDERGLPGEFVLICVSDTGMGMPDSVVAKAFDPFFTTKEVGKGTGLGLSQVYGFVKQSGGHIAIRSSPGEGTTVEIHLPRYHGATAADRQDADARDLALGRREEVVLVVEDEPGVRQFSTDALGELGYRVLEADGAAAALRLLDAHPEIALLFTDVVMPEVNGAKLAEEARRRRPDLRILFTTGYTRDAVVHDGVLDPGVELLGKPYSVEELAAKVRHVLDA
jgi:PAS domain S-box-containing protein